MAGRTPPQDALSTVRTPMHPVPQLQGPFEESMLESVYDDSEPEQYLDPASRRTILLESVVYQRVVAGRWKQKPGEKFHPLWKLVAQISFGVHLLAESMARSEEDVMEILQTHVDEIDGFLERTTEDFDLSLEDIQERLRCLKLPLRHPEVFDRMLEDRKFRNSIVEGNEKIEHIIDRTTRHMKDSLKDVQKGFDSTTALEKYLQGLELTWRRRTPEHEAVYVAMLGNVEGWRKAFMDLHLQGNKLGGFLKKLTQIINEMQQRAGEVSRRLLHQARGFDSVRTSRSQHSQPAQSSQHSQAMGRPAAINTPVSRFQVGGASQKRLPTAPVKSLSGSISTIQHSRSQTPQQMQQSGKQTSAEQQSSRSATPSAQQLLNTGSPLVVQNLQVSSSRIRSMVPSVVEESQSPGSDSSKLDREPVRVEKTYPVVELPAHVPEETLRAAPMSKANRLSMGLGILPSDRKMKSSSKSYSPTAALIDLLRSSPNPSKPTKLPLTPQSMTPNSESPVGKASSENGSGYFVSRDARSQTESITQPRGINTPRLDTRSATNSPAASQITSPVPSVADEKRAELRRGAFNSHPPDVPLGSPPTSQLQTPGTSSKPSIKRTPSVQSSADDGVLGEPGPELTVPSSNFNLGTANHLKRASAMAPELVMMRTPQVQSSPAPVHKTENLAAAEAEVPEKKREFVAEMEGCAPKFLETPIDQMPVFAELEAPQKYSQLPPLHELPSPTSKSNENSTINSHPDTIVGVQKLEAFVSNREPDVDKDKQTDKHEGDNQSAIMVNSGLTIDTQAHDSDGVTQPSPTKPPAVQNLIDQLSYTPPGSPIHKRDTSSTSTNSALAEPKRQGHRLGPNHPCPAPPGPSGPAMTKIDTAVAGQFYGERKQHHRTHSKESSSSQSSQNVWKAFFQGQPSPVGGTLSIRNMKRTSTDQQSLSSRKSPVPGMSPLQPPTTSPFLTQKKSSESMMTPAGKDVLWFGKTDGMERVAMATAAKNQTQPRDRPPPPTGPVEME